MRTFRRAASTFAMVVMLALAGCGGGEEDPTTPGPSGDSEVSPSGEAPEETDASNPDETTTSAEDVEETPSGDPTSLPPLEYETPPELPEAAASHDEVGAEAFVEYAVEVLNYAQRQNDPEAVRAISDPECMFCNLQIEDIETLRNNEWRRVGGDMTFQPESTRYQEAGELYFVNGPMQVSEINDYGTDGELLGTHEGAQLAGTFAVGIQGDEWVIFSAGADSGF